MRYVSTGRRGSSPSVLCEMRYQSLAGYPANVGELMSSGDKIGPQDLWEGKELQFFGQWCSICACASLAYLYIDVFCTNCQKDAVITSKNTEFGSQCTGR